MPTQEEIRISAAKEMAKHFHDFVMDSLANGIYEGEDPEAFLKQCLEAFIDVESDDE